MNPENESSDLTEDIETFIEFAEKEALPLTLGVESAEFLKLPRGGQSKLLIKKGVAVPIVAGDWSVNRMRQSADLIGLKSWEELQNFLKRHYSTDDEQEIHFHKGPGNGALMDDLRKKDANWKQIGMGDRLYFTVEDTLLKFAKPDAQKTPGFDKFLSVLGLGLRRTLKDKWFENSDSHVVGDLTMKEGEEVNLNDLRLMFTQPDNLYSKLEVKELAGRMEYLVSVEFEKDGYAPLPNEAKVLFDEFRSAIAAGTVVEFFRRFFDEPIFNQEHDLNEDAVFHEQGFMPGYFKEIPKQVPASSCLLMSAIRSDSHENAQSFGRDIRKNLACLKPGGVLLTDGNRQSYTRFSRLKEIQDALKGNSEFEARVICGNNLKGESGEILGVAIQRKHPNKDFFWDLDDEDKPFREDVKYLTLEKAMNRVDQQLLDSTLGLVYRWAKEDMSVFRSLHEKIREAVKSVVLEYMNEQGSLRDALEDVLDLLPEQIAEIRVRLLPILGGLLPQTDSPVVDGDGVQVFDRIGQRKSGYNRSTFIPADQIPKHETDATHFSAREKQLWAKEFLEKMGDRRLYLVDPDGKGDIFGCETNQLFDGFLRAALCDKYDECVVQVPFKVNPIAVTSRLTEILNRDGGLVFAGGSWKDVASQEGRVYERQFMAPLLSQILAGVSQIGLVAECFSAQALANCIGSYSGGNLTTKKGSLEFGPFTTTLQGTHPIFEGLPQRLAVAMTRSGHIVGKADPRLWTPLANLEYSGEDVLWAGPNNGVLAAAGHLSIRQHTQAVGSDVHRVMEFIDANPLALVESHGVVAGDLASNWPLLKENPGTRLLANMLMVAAQASQKPSKWEMRPA